MNTPVFNKLKEYYEKDFSSFHTPGHKNKAESLISLMNEIYKFDQTEVEGLDSLYEASGIIKESEENAAKVYDTKRSLYSTGGCTQAIKAMLKLSLPSGGKLLTGRIIHNSAISAMGELKIDPVFLYNKIRGSFYEALSSEQIKEALVKDKEIKAVYLTSPDYYGIMSNIKEISKITKQYNIPLIIDCAHGSHLKFLRDDLDPINLGADMSADSLHKTLPVLTGGAVLNINNEKYLDDAKCAMKFFGSTSPSYRLMASIDLCMAWLDKKGRKSFLLLEEKIGEIKNYAKNLGYSLPQGLNDPVRLALNTDNFNVSSKLITEILHENKIEPEYVSGNNFILIPSPFNDDKDFERLKSALLKISEISSKENQDQKMNIHEQYFLTPKKQLSLNEALFCDYEYIDVNKSTGRICLETVSVCPPGIPIIIPGEIINKEIKENLIKSFINKVKVLK